MELFSDDEMARMHNIRHQIILPSRERFLFEMLDRACEDRARRMAERDGEREAREKIEVAYRKQDAAMGVLFERLNRAGVDCSDLIP